MLSRFLHFFGSTVWWNAPLSYCSCLVDGTKLHDLFNEFSCEHFLEKTNIMNLNSDVSTRTCCLFLIGRLLKDQPAAVLLWFTDCMCAWCSLCSVSEHAGSPHKYSCWSVAADDSHNYRLSCPTAEKERKRGCVCGSVDTGVQTEVLTKKKPAEPPGGLHWV